MRVRIEMDGLLGVGATAMTWLGFSAHAVDKTKPVPLRHRLSELPRGRSLAGKLSIASDTFVTSVVAAYINREVKGKLRKIVPITSKRK